MRNERKIYTLEEVPLPKQDEVLEILRQLRAVLNAHKMYPPGHQMLRRINTRLHEEVQKRLQKAPFLALLFTAEGTEVNGERLNRPSPERQFGREIATHYQTLGINTVVFPKDVKRNELSDFFDLTLRHNIDVDGSLDLDGLATRFYTVDFNKQVIRRGGSNKIRDKMSLRELMASMDRESLLKELGLQPDQIPPELQELFDEKERADQGKQKEDNLRKESEAFAQYVRSGRFLAELFQTHQSSDQWPTISGHHPPRSSFTNLPSLGTNPMMASSGQLPQTPNKPTQSMELPAAKTAFSADDIPAIQGQPLEGSSALNRIDWNSLAQRPEAPFPSHWQPAALASSDEFEDFVRTGKAQEYLQAFLAQQHQNMGVPLPTPGLPAGSTGIDPLLVQQQIQSALQQFNLSAQKLPDEQMKQIYQEQIAQQISNTPPDVLAQYVMQLSHTEPFQAELRKSLLSSLPSEQIEASQEALLAQIRQAPSKDFVEGGVGVLQEFIDQQIEKGVYSGLKKLLHRLDENGMGDSISVKEGLEKLMDHVSEPEKVHQLLEDGKQRLNKEAREVLGELAPQAIPQALDELANKSAEDPGAFQQQVELLIEVARSAPPKKRDDAFQSLFERMRSGLVIDEQQDVILELSRRFAPRIFEDYLLHRLTDPLQSSERERLLNQAIAHDSPKIRAFLAKYLQSRALSHLPELEELILQYLERVEALDGLVWLAQELEDTENEPGRRHTAIWMLGLFQDDKSVALLKRILFDKRKKSFAYSDDMRFQALHTLTRFPRPQVLMLIQKMRDDGNPLLKGYAVQMTQETTPEEESAARTLYFTDLELSQNTFMGQGLISNPNIVLLVIATIFGLLLGLLAKWLLG
ncbi:MAG: hypothetical protein H6727_04965 [Myxococcales bacterium]|nr:hypothetical protein [Myxococcales bacterium]